MLKELARYYDVLDVGLIEKTFAGEEVNYNQNQSGKRNNNHLMMYEGRIATFYWDCLAKVFNKLYPNFHFKSRKNKSYSWNMNASDEINSLLNYRYAVLESEIRRDLNGIGLDPAIGFLHELAESKQPLVYDIQELFQWLIDLSVVQLLEEKKLKKSDFIVTENYHIRLRPATAKTLIERISLNFNRAIPYKSKSYTYHSILLDNVQQLVNFIVGKKSLQFSIPHAKILRNDPSVLRERILTMSPAERKRLGINKSTLWYQKRQLTKGMSIKLYGKVLSRLE